MSDDAAAPTDPPDPEAQAWRAFVQSLGDVLAEAWPEMAERLGTRRDEFVEHAARQARLRGIDRAAGIARYVNLCAVWGPSFQDKAGFEWAKGILAGPPSRQWLSVHQLVRRSLAELGRVPQARVEPERLARVDARLIDRYESLGSAGALRRPPPAAPLPRSACDLEAVELRVLGDVAAPAYHLEPDGGWRRAAPAAVAPLRVSLVHPPPERVALFAPMAPVPGTAPRLQVRARAAATCDAERHPGIAFLGTHGRWAWQGHETRAVSFPVEALAQPVQPRGPGTAIAEETSPGLSRLDLACCGLRDEGEALGPQQWTVWVWPSTQWWIEWQRVASEDAHSVAAGGDPAPTRVRTRARVEADGLPQDAGPLTQGFVSGLDAATGAALGTLASDWAAIDGLSRATLEGQLALLCGEAGLSWGWQPGAGGLGARAVMRLVGRLRLSAVRARLAFHGELSVDGAPVRVTLQVEQQVPLEAIVGRETDAAPVLDAVLPLVARFRLPLVAQVDPVAADGGALVQAAGPLRGALVGEAGLRPCATGSGWSWFAALRIEPLVLPLEIVDPLLGTSHRDVKLLPPRTLVDWSLS